MPWVLVIGRSAPAVVRDFRKALVQFRVEGVLKKGHRLYLFFSKGGRRTRLVLHFAAWETLRTGFVEHQWHCFAHLGGAPNYLYACIGSSKVLELSLFWRWYFLRPQDT